MKDFDNLIWMFSAFCLNSVQSLLAACLGPMQRSKWPFQWGGFLPTSCWERLSRMTSSLWHNSMVSLIYVLLFFFSLVFIFCVCVCFHSVCIHVCCKVGHLYNDPMTFKCNKQGFPDLPEWLRFIQRHHLDDGFLYGTPTSPGKTIIEVWVFILCTNSVKRLERLSDLWRQKPRSRLQQLFWASFKKGKVLLQINSWITSHALSSAGVQNFTTVYILFSLRALSS